MEPSTLHALWIVFMVAVLAFFAFLAWTLRSDVARGERGPRGREASRTEPTRGGSVAPEGRTDDD